MIRDARDPTARELELLRHAARELDSDRLSARGRSEAEALGRRRRAEGISWEVVFVSPAARAAETAAWILRGAGVQLGAHSEVPGLGGAAGTTPEEMGAGVRALLDQIPFGSRALAIGHTPLIERAVFGLVGREPPPLGPCEGVLIRADRAGSMRVTELRLVAQSPSNTSDSTDSGRPGHATTNRSELNT
jgi:phosphohistidine phosphatase SixA